MTKDELEAEREAIRIEHAALQREHDALKANPRDRAGHATHRLRLKKHHKRLHAFIAACDPKDD